jgi:hypothetical protein
VLADRLADDVDADLLVVVCRVEAGENLAGKRSLTPSISARRRS